MTTIAKSISGAAFALLIAAGTAQQNRSDRSPANDVLEVIAAQPDLSIFAEAIKAAGLESTLRRKGPWTVLAPSNDAFRALPAGTLTEWSKPENRDVLTDVIEYHVIRGKYLAKAISTEEVETLQGSRVVLKAAEGVVWVGRAEVLKGDQEGTNGVVQVINMVLEPDGQ